MKTHNDRGGFKTFDFDESDLEDALVFKEMMATKGWKRLRDYYEQGKADIMQAGMEGIRTRSKRDLSDIKWAILKGFIECSMIPERLVRQAQEFVKKEKEAEEVLSNGQHPDDGR